MINFSEWRPRGFLRAGVAATSLSTALRRVSAFDASQCVTQQRTHGWATISTRTMRKDITEGKPVFPLKLRLTVLMQRMRAR